ncbi:MAG TPA: COX15/CtaA family protein [Chitinophagaceae bacterium]|nr:COX15/CtaA family protein [Chitinophagaceae bacterium]
MTHGLPQRSSKPVAIWLLIGVGMIIVQILLGGITRLTGSGLSITEWNVVTGTLPPMSHHQWMLEFEKYKTTPQFHLLNFDFTLANFKHIFFWEWFHRLWARLIGVVFAIPFIVFIIQKRFKASMVKPMIILFLLGALQGAIGWIMVASGLTGDATYVKPAKLALHFIFALGLLCYTFWFALQLLVPANKTTSLPSIRKLNVTILAILVLQLIYGAFMAGHKAATAAATWPDINGHFIPPGMVNKEEGWLSFIDQKIAIQFIHRGLAYILLVLIIIFTFRIYKKAGASLLRKTGWLPMGLVFLQVILGIAAVISSVQIVPNHWGIFEWLAQIHQLVAMFLLLSLVWTLFLSRQQTDS